MEKYYVYIHYKKITGEGFYVGKGKKWRRNESSSRNPLWHNIVNKHGFYSVIIESDLSEDDAFVLEKELILRYGRRNNNTGILANMTDGGEGVSGLTQTDEHRQKSSDSMKRREIWKMHSKQVIHKETGNVYESSGDAARKIPIHQATVSNICRGKQIKEGFTLRYLDSSGEAIEPILRQDKLRRRVICIDTRETFKTITEAAKALKLSAGQITQVCKGQLFKVKGKTMRYIDENDNIIEPIITCKIPKKVKCLENGVVYNSVNEAAAELGIGRQGIYKVCDGRLKTTRGLTFEVVI